MSKYDPEIEKMILYGIEYTDYYTSPTREAKIQYRAISDLEERYAFKDLLSEIPLETDEKKLELFEKTELDEKGNEIESFKQKMERLRVSPLDVEIANFHHKVSIVYHGIKDFYFPDLSYEDGLELVSKFDEKDLINLSELILAKSSSIHKDNEKRVTRFRA